jgi:hypothetical protein
MWVSKPLWRGYGHCTALLETPMVRKGPSVLRTAVLAGQNMYSKRYYSEWEIIMPSGAKAKTKKKLIAKMEKRVSDRDVKKAGGYEAVKKAMKKKGKKK